MRYTMLLALTACLGCAGTESGNAFRLRPSAFSIDPATLPPNKAQEHEMNLQRAIDHAIEQQESEDGLQLKCRVRTFEDVVNCNEPPRVELLEVCE